MRTIGGLVIVLGLATAACAGDPVSVSIDTYRGLPSSVPIDDPRHVDLVATWVDRGSTFSVTTWGSSSCPPVPVRVEGNDDVVTVTYDDNRHNVCTADLAPTTRVLELPDGMDDSPLRVKLAGLGEPVQLTLP